MAYVQRITKAGRAIFIDKYYTNRYKKKGYNRKEKMKDTKQAQEIINNRITERKVAVMLDASFVPGDYHFVLTYEYGKRPATPELAQQDLREYLREIKKQAKKNKIEIKYIAATEIGSKGGLHHHIIMNKVPRDLIFDAWTHGTVRFGRNLDDSGEWSKLAAYIIKCKAQWKKNKCKGRAWSSSRNLNRPEPEIEIIPQRQQFRTEPRPKNGYYIPEYSKRQGFHEKTGYQYLSYIMVPTERREEDVGKNLHRDHYHRKI